MAIPPAGLRRFRGIRAAVSLLVVEVLEAWIPPIAAEPSTRHAAIIALAGNADSDDVRVRHVQ